MDVEEKQLLTKFGEIIIEQDKKLNSVDKLLNMSLSYLSEIIIDQDKKLSSTDQMLNNSFSYLCTNINELNSKISILENKLNNLIEPQQTNNDTPIIKKIKRKRPLFYFLTKHWKYKKLLEQKRLLETEIEEKIKFEKEIRRKLEEKEKQERLNNLQKNIKDILKTKKKTN